MLRWSKLFIVVLTVLIFATAAFAFAASNTMPAPSFAGEGMTITSGYTVSNVVYTLNGTTPSNIDSVRFDLDNPATTVKVRLVSPTGSYYSCTAAGSTWTCLTSGVTVTAANEFRVIAVQ